MVIVGYTCLNMVRVSYTRLYMLYMVIDVIHGYIYMVIHGYMDGYSRLYVVIHDGYRCIYMAMHGYRWLYMVIHGIVCYTAWF